MLSEGDCQANIDAYRIWAKSGPSQLVIFKQFRNNLYLVLMIARLISVGGLGSELRDGG